MKLFLEDVENDDRITEDFIYSGISEDPIYNAVSGFPFITSTINTAFR